MTQSVEVILDEVAETAVFAQWGALAEARLPTAQRQQPDVNHRPHITLYAADAVPAEAEARLNELLPGLDLSATVGPVTVFGPRHGKCILVRSVIGSPDLLALQQQVATICGADPSGLFAAGQWVPHVTLARRMSSAQVAIALEVLGEARPLTTRITQCRRWDGDARTAWWLT